MFGDAGIKAVLKELQQLHNRGMLEPTDQHNDPRRKEGRIGLLNVS